MLTISAELVAKEEILDRTSHRHIHLRGLLLQQHLCLE